MMRRNSSLPDSWDSSFINIFYGATNGLGIPTGLFDSLNTTNGTRFSSMFADTFSQYARNSTTGTIPTGLFDSLNTTNGTNFSYMFAATFQYYAYNSTAAAIPAGLFDSIDTSSGTSFIYMFSNTFNSYAYNSTTGTIPAGLFDSIDTSSGTSFSYMFSGTFSGYAQNSTTATIPAGLFDSLDTANGTNFSYMFYNTFNNYAYNSTTATIPAGLFDSLDTANGTNFSYMFTGTFSNYSTRTPTFIRSSDQASHTGSSFAELYAVSVNGGAPATSPTVTAGSTIKPSYNTTTRTINPPSAVSGLTWYRTDGTSCLIANPTENCGAQNASSLVTFPNTTEWTPETSTEKGNVSFYSRIVTDIVMSNSDIGEWHSPGYVVGQFETTASPSYPGFTYTLVPDNGDDLDNSAFTISGSSLILNTTPNYDAQPIYYINIQTTDANGNTFIKRFELNVVEADEVVPDPGTETPNSDIGLGSPNTGFMKLDEVKNSHIKFWFISLVVLSVVAGTIAKFVQHRSLNHKRSK